MKNFVACTGIIICLFITFSAMGQPPTIFTDLDKTVEVPAGHTVIPVYSFQGGTQASVREAMANACKGPSGASGLAAGTLIGIQYCQQMGIDQHGCLGVCARPLQEKLDVPNPGFISEISTVEVPDNHLLETTYSLQPAGFETIKGAISTACSEDSLVSGLPGGKLVGVTFCENFGGGFYGCLGVCQRPLRNKPGQ